MATAAVKENYSSGSDSEDDSTTRVGYVTHTVKKEDLKPGDHIYSYRKLHIYSHHGIYIGEPDCEVIHINSTDALKGLNEWCMAKMEKNVQDLITIRDEAVQKAGEREQSPLPVLATQDPVRPLMGMLHLTLANAMMSERILEGRNPGEGLKTPPLIPNHTVTADTVKEFSQHRRQQYGINIGVQSCSLSEFRKEKSKLRLVSYNASSAAKRIKKKPSCHIVECMPASETIKLAKHFMKHPDQWGEYSLLGDNNCETFACFCKTGLMDISAQAHTRERGVSYEKDRESFRTFEEAMKNYKRFKNGDTKIDEETLINSYVMIELGD